MYWKCAQSVYIDLKNLHEQDNDDRMICVDFTQQHFFARLVFGDFPHIRSDRECIKSAT